MRLLAFFSLFLILFSAAAFSEEEVQLEVEGCTLKGTLTTQDDVSKSTPLMILIAGSGPTNRDGNNDMMTNNSLKMVSDMLAQNGHACLRYDKRSIAESKVENLDRGDLSFDQFISDASAWVSKYATDIRFSKIILVGHSQGALVAMCAANENENVDAVISLAGAGQKIHEILKVQLAATLSIGMQGLINAKLDTLAMGDTLKRPPEGIANLFHPSIQPFLISWMKYDPSEEAAKLKVPLLLVNGTTDLQVGISEAKLLAEANKNANVSIVKNMNHILKFTKEIKMAPQLEIYGNPDLPLHKKLPKILLMWLEGLD